jgi:ribulose kinase
MAATITKKGLAMFIVGTSKTDILTAIVNQRYPTVSGFFFNASDSTYHIIAEIK